MKLTKNMADLKKYLKRGDNSTSPKEVESLVMGPQAKQILNQRLQN